MVQIPELVLEAYDRAHGSWTGADWRHERRVKGDYVYELSGYVVYCEGPPHPGVRCDVCNTARKDARKAERHARNAMSSIRMGDWGWAENEIEQACCIEAEYGEAVTWNRVRIAIAWAMADRKIKTNKS